MRAVIVYESIYGNTHVVAEAIGRGLAPVVDVTVVPVGDAVPELVANADLIVVGGPTHLHGMSRECSRRVGVSATTVPDGTALDRHANGPGVRDWLATVAGAGTTRVAAFDTRVVGAPLFTGRASKGIAKALRRHGFTQVAAPESFLVTKDNHLSPDQEQRAVEWGRQLRAALLT